MRILAIALLVALGACASPLLGLVPQGQVINEASLSATVAAAKAECVRAPALRKAYLDAINERLALSKIVVQPLDCNGDGIRDLPE